jgi:hypothetical protein
MNTSTSPLVATIVMAPRARVGTRQRRFAPKAKRIPAAANGRTKGAASEMRPEVECPGGPQPSVPPSKDQRSKYAAGPTRVSASVASSRPSEAWGWARAPSLSSAFAAESVRGRLPLRARSTTLAVGASPSLSWDPAPDAARRRRGSREWSS